MRFLYSMIKLYKTTSNNDFNAIFWWPDLDEIS